MIFQGPPLKLLSNGVRSLTGQYLRAERTIPTPTARRPALKGELVIRGARANNLKALDVKVPLGLLTAVTGVSGSGKSTLVNDILYRALARTLYRAADEPGTHDRIEGIDLVDKVIQIDQSPSVGRPVLIRRRIRGCSPLSVSFSRCYPSHGPAGTGPAGSPSTSRAGGVKNVRGTASSRSRCTSCLTSM